MPNSQHVLQTDAITPLILERGSTRYELSTSYNGVRWSLNWLVFDKNYLLLNGGYQRISSTPREYGQDVAHELMSSPAITITQPGYVYIYLSNEEAAPVEVYFDDFKVTQTKSPVIQTDDYYPFGLTFNSYQRENSTTNDFKFQGQERQDELGLNWDSFKWRNHQPDIGRFFNVDPLAEKYVYNSPYAFSENKVIAHRELEGLESQSVHQTVSNINVTPVWQSEVSPAGDPSVVDHYNVNFTLTQQETRVDFDEHNVAVATVETKSTSVHRIAVPVGGMNLDTNPKTNPNPYNFTTDNSKAFVTTKVTPVAAKNESNSSSTSRTFRDTGMIMLDKKNTAIIKQAVIDKGQSQGLLLQKYARFIFSSEKDSHHRKLVSPPRH